MRIKDCWVLALILSGCQLNQPIDTEQIDGSTTNNKPLSNNELHKENRTSSEHSPITTPQTQQDVWRRISMQLEMPVPDNRIINYYRTWYINHPNHLKTVAKRAEPFLYLITEKIEARKMPLELALLPVVESSFDAFAYSHGSAAGLWQFVSGTAKMYGLEQSFWYDGRRDVAAATDAALDYLSYLNKRFDGDWTHAIAAYNSGGGRVSSAIRKNNKLGKPTDFFSLDLPKETSGYLPKLLALADVIANQEKYGVSIPEIANHPVVELVDPKEQLDLAVAANYAGITVRKLQSLNPAYNQWATAPNGPQKLLLPIHSVDRFQQALSENKGQGIKVIRYQVRSGDSLIAIAKRYKTTPKLIRSANDITGNRIRIGQFLMIPTSTKENSVYALSASNRLAKTQAKARGHYKITHIVKRGDSLWSIAQNNKVSHQVLAKWNGMGPRDTLKVGQKLVIWKNNSQGSIIRTVFYNVRSGDTISGIAKRFKVKTGDIVKWNSLNSRNYLKPGQKLKLYVDVTKVSV